VLLWSALILGGCKEDARAIAPEPSLSSSATQSAAVHLPDAEAPPDAQTPPDAQAPATVTECPPGQRIQRNLDDWRRRLKQAKTADQRNAVLSELGLRQVDDSSDSSGVHSLPTLDEIDIRAAALATDAPDDRIVSVSYSRRVEGVDSTSVRIQALRRMGTNEWCRLGSPPNAELEVDQLQTENACLGASDMALPVRATPVNLTHPRMQTLKVLRQSGHCDGCGRSGEVEVRYYDASGFSLRLLFSHTLYSASYSGCPWPPVKEKVGSLELEGAYPKQIVATTEILCHAPMDGLPEHYREACSPEVITARHELRGGVYVALASTPSAQPSRLPLHIDDAELSDTRRGSRHPRRGHQIAGRDGLEAP
jgi:hypothetical protein